MTFSDNLYNCISALFKGQSGIFELLQSLSGQNSADTLIFKVPELLNSTDRAYIQIQFSDNKDFDTTVQTVSSRTQPTGFDIYQSDISGQRFESLSGHNPDNLLTDSDSGNSLIFNVKTARYSVYLYLV